MDKASQQKLVQHVSMAQSHTPHTQGTHVSRPHSQEAHLAHSLLLPAAYSTLFESIAFNIERKYAFS